MPSPTQVARTAATLRDPMAARGPILICTLISLFAPGLRLTFQPAGERIARVRFVVPE